MPSTASRPRRVTLALPDVTLELQTDRGVFSAARVDPGTKLLLQEAPAHGGVLLDLGCGYGPIAVTLARRVPEATVWAVDVNERARSLTMANAQEAGAENVTVAAPGQIPRDLAFDALYSNPPIRIGKTALWDILDAWLPRAAVGYLVVQKNLGSDSLQRWMGEARGWAVDRLVSRAGYRLLRVVPGSA